VGLKGVGPDVESLRRIDGWLCEVLSRSDVGCKAIGFLDDFVEESSFDKDFEAGIRAAVSRKVPVIVQRRVADERHPVRDRAIPGEDAYLGQPPAFSTRYGIAPGIATAGVRIAVPFVQNWGGQLWQVDLAIGPPSDIPGEVSLTFPALLAVSSEHPEGVPVASAQTELAQLRSWFRIGSGPLGNGDMFDTGELVYPLTHAEPFEFASMAGGATRFGTLFRPVPAPTCAASTIPLSDVVRWAANPDGTELRAAFQRKTVVVGWPRGAGQLHQLIDGTVVSSEEAQAAAVDAILHRHLARYARPWERFATCWAAATLGALAAWAARGRLPRLLGLCAGVAVVLLVVSAGFFIWRETVFDLIPLGESAIVSTGLLFVSTVVCCSRAGVGTTSGASS
jgi:hypothetical protein